MQGNLFGERHCTPEECPHCVPWDCVPGKARCERDPDKWFSVCLGQTCCKGEGDAE
jgi:hypothetical protein